MRTSDKIARLKRLLDQAAEITVRDSDDSTFKTWKNTVERTLIRVFGSDSPELEQFHELPFFYHAAVMTLGSDYSRENRECFERDFKILTSSIENYIEELGQDHHEQEELERDQSETVLHKVFISHSSQDAGLVEDLVDLLEIIGLPEELIFCTSLPGYGIALGENFLDAIREELSNDTLVLFVLTQSFYASPVCLCEMGATWVQARDHIPILVPPLDFADVKGVVPLTQGFKINDELKLNLLKQKIESDFGLTSVLSPSAWERKRDRILVRINKKITPAK